MTNDDGSAQPEDERTIVAALAQSASMPGDVVTNVRRHIDHVESARAAGAAVVIFPELSLTGYELHEIAARADLRMDPLDARLDPLREASRTSGLPLLCGAPVLDPTGTLLASLASLPNGSTLVYGKRNLYGHEREPFVAGSTPLVLDVDGHRLAVGVCADLADQAQVDELRTLAVDAWALGVLVTPDGWAADSARAREAARASGASVLLVNHSAPTGGWPTAGRSGGWGPEGMTAALAPAHRGPDLAGGAPRYASELRGRASRRRPSVFTRGADSIPLHPALWGWNVREPGGRNR